MFNSSDMLWNSSKIFAIHLEEKFRSTCLTGLYNYYWSTLSRLCRSGFNVQPLDPIGFDFDTQVFLLKLYWARRLIVRLSLVHHPLSVFPSITYRVEIPYVRRLGMLDISSILIFIQRYSNPTRNYMDYYNITTHPTVRVHILEKSVWCSLSENTYICNFTKSGLWILANYFITSFNQVSYKTHMYLYNHSTFW